jgi:pimeloyl-ACP methyl ester carboxylesterase
VVFLGGLRSDMTGTKAVHLEEWARRSGRAFLRFDYSGHGASSGVHRGVHRRLGEDAEAAITSLTEGPVVLVGSSMGGWISLLMAKRMPEKLAGLVTIAAAPDFHRGRDVGRLVRGAARDADGGGATGPAVGLWRGHDHHAKR